MQDAWGMLHHGGMVFSMGLAVGGSTSRSHCWHAVWLVVVIHTGTLQGRVRGLFCCGLWALSGLLVYLYLPAGCAGSIHPSTGGAANLGGFLVGDLRQNLP